MEVWKDIIGFEGMYKISPNGAIKSLSRVVQRGNSNMLVREKILTIQNRIDTYKIVDLYRNNKRKRFFLHRLIAIHFIPNPLNKKEVNHIDGNPSNNYIENLEWVTPSENMKHSYKHGSCSLQYLNKTRGGDRVNAKPVIQMDLNGNIIKKWPSIADASREINSRPTDICSTLSGRQKTCKGFRWKYASEQLKVE